MLLASTLKARLREAAIRAVQDFDDGLDRRLFRDPDTRERPSRDGRWFTERERRLTETLAARILPSDAIGPGAREAGVASHLDRLLAEGTPEKRAFYGRGLLALDRLARGSGRAFAELSEPEQLRLLERLDREADSRFESVLARKIPRRVTTLYYRWRFPAVDFFAGLVDDVFEAFYTSPVAWSWLGYDGPPMPQGYLDPTRPRA